MITQVRHACVVGSLRNSHCDTVCLPCRDIFGCGHTHVMVFVHKLKFQIVDFPDGMPGDVGITLKWA